MAQWTSDLDAFEIYHQEQEDRASFLGGPALPALGHALAGSTGSAVSNVAVYPLSVIITRLQLQHQLRKQEGSAGRNRDVEYSSVLDAATKIYKKEGLAGFYAGCVEDTGKTVVDSFLFFLAYNFLRKKAGASSNNGKGGKMSVSTELLVGMLAGAFSKFWTTPIATVVTRLQSGSISDSGGEKDGTTKSKPTFTSIINEVREERGLLGFWAGYPQYLILTINPSLSFFFFEAFKRILVRRDQRDNPPPHMTFIMAAVGKALASAATYPFSLVKARKQAEKKTSSSPDNSKSDSTSNGPFQGVLRGTPVGDVLAILQSEGPGALYEGLTGEVMKGFFSQGITMTLKDSIHVGIIQTYYVILRLLNRYPAPTEAAKTASNKLNEIADALNPYPTRQGSRRAQQKNLRPYPKR